MIYKDLSHKKHNLRANPSVQFLLMSGFVRSSKSTRKIAKPFADSRNFEKTLINVCVCSESSETRNNRD